MPINNGFCCERMKLAVDDIDCPLNYKPKLRYYGMSAPKSLLKKNQIWPGYMIEFCPFCSAKLPKDLVGELFEVLEKEYGIDDPYYNDQRKGMPQEFETDEWWRKRGL